MLQDPVPLPTAYKITAWQAQLSLRPPLCLIKLGGVYYAIRARFHTVQASFSGMDPAKQQQQKPASSKPSLEAAARPKPAYSVAPISRRRSKPVVKRVEPEEVAIQPLQRLDDPRQWPRLVDSLISDEDSTAAQYHLEDESHQQAHSPAAAQPVERSAKTQTTNLFTLPANRGPSRTSPAHNRATSSDASTAFSTDQRLSSNNQHTASSQHARSPRAADGPRHMVHRHPPRAPEDPQELLQV
jgi:hypothetical protein